ncbi:integrin alpha-9-like [Ischnura elegans]|uniref:integrin alpha-9-like n=1 Tax=Ischnura elegans TaxID=197161 RepID=UPI001ED8AA93|nr:integrin alpha-9-like [Ischnura elegans]
MEIPPLRTREWLILFATVFLFNIPIASPFNLDVEHATVFSDPFGQAGSYFGYSVALMKKPGTLQRGGGWLVVGAPRGNSTIYPSNVIEPGVAYLCEIGEGQGKCKHMILDDTGNDRYSSPGGFASYADNKNHAWIGASIAVQENGGKIVVCGPRWKNKYYRDFYLMNGVCYQLSDPRFFDRKALKLIPLLLNRKQGFVVPSDYDPDRNLTQAYYYAYGGAGVSVDFVPNATELIIGAPGVFDWKGSVVRYRVSSSILGDAGSSLVNNNNRGVMYDEVLTPNPFRNTQLNPSAFFGYSIGSGRFYSPDRIHYVAGAPRAGHLLGKVFIYEFPPAEEQPFLIKMELEGYQFGEYFGSSLCVVDLNSDGLDDLIVGAPLYSLKLTSNLQLSGDEGRVYVFMNEGQGIMSEIGDNVKIMGSHIHGARFGTAISNIGDLNGDGHPDVAVGAPFENSGSGAVYIYHGRENGLNAKFSQRITAQDIGSSLKGFGMSITKGSDIDANQYNDIAVGAFSSGNVVLLRSHPVIAFHNTLAASVSSVNINATGFMVKACVLYSGKYAPAFTDVMITLKADPVFRRASIVGPSGRNATLVVERKLKHYVELCDEYEIAVVNAVHDLSKPIQITMNTEIKNSKIENENIPSNHRNLQKRDLNGKGFCSTCPVVDPTRNSQADLRVPYATGCGEDNICRTDLKVEGYLMDIETPYIIGSSPSLQMNVTVKNLGDPAFFSRTDITFSKLLSLIRVPNTCEEISQSQLNESSGERGLTCDTGNPLRRGVEKQFLFEFDTRQIPIGHENLVFKIRATNIGEEVNTENNEVILDVPLETVADITITGKSSQSHFYFNREDDKEMDKTFSFSHVYEVLNYGPSSIDQVKMVFEVPAVLKTGEDNHHFVRLYQPQTSLNLHSFSCSAEGGEFYSESIKATGTQPTGVPLSTTFPESSQNVSNDQPLREKRSTDQGYVYSPAYFPSNKTLFVNCSNSEEGCMVITCYAGPLKVSQTGGVIVFPMKVIASNLDHVFEDKDVILFASSGKVEILGMKHSIQPRVHKPDFVDVHTLFFGKLREGTVDSWIIAVAIAGGILLLFLIVMGLMKMGFFKRGTKEELEALKEKAELEDNFSNDLG